MVAAEKGDISEGRAGKRSRGASPNGHFSDSSDEEREGGGGMRVGRDYQAQVPPLVPSAERKLDQYADRALLVWSPNDKLTENDLEQYIIHSKEKYGYNAEQALGMLFWHKHDLEKALNDLANFTPFPDEWSIEDKVLFEQAFQFHGKSFHRIRQMLPDKSIAALVRYYYSWKKTRMKSSLMDRQVRRVTAQKNEENTENVEPRRGAASDSETEDRADNKEDGLNACHNCGISCSSLQSTAKGSLCATCANHLKKTGMMRPTAGPIRRDKQTSLANQGRSKGRPPRGMYLDHDDLVTFATNSEVQCDAIIKAMDSEIVNLKRTVQSNKQVLGVLKKRTSEGLNVPKMSESVGRINSRWTAEEQLLGVQGIRKYGKDFKAIAEIIGTKTANHVRMFFVSSRTRYNLDAVLREYEAENGPSPPDDKMEAESSGTDVAQPSGTSTPASAAGNISAKNSTKSLATSKS